MKTPQTHQEQRDLVKPVVPCAAWHITFGGRCLNCGWDPARATKKEEN